MGARRRLRWQLSRHRSPHVYRVPTANKSEPADSSSKNTKNLLPSLKIILTTPSLNTALDMPVIFLLRLDSENYKPNLLCRRVMLNSRCDSQTPVCAIRRHQYVLSI